MPFDCYLVIVVRFVIVYFLALAGILVPCSIASTDCSDRLNLHWLFMIVRDRRRYFLLKYIFLGVAKTLLFSSFYQNN